jgi:hypothetical protein
MTGAELIAAERQRQIEVEGYEPEHDTAHADESLALAACSYAIPWSWRRFRSQRISVGDDETYVEVPTTWPWAVWHWKPSPDDRVRELIKAGALIAAEIDRIRALSSVPSLPGDTTEGEKQ